MDDLISRSATLKEMRLSWKNPYKIVESAPAVDAEPVKHGRWVHDINNLYGCSECLGRETMSHKKLKPYCPNCGAKMDGDANA